MKRAAFWVPVLILIASSSAFARGPADVVRIEGIITAIDDVALTIDVADVTVQVTPATIIKMGPELLIGFEDLDVGMTVMVCGHSDGDVLLARQITVKYCGK